MPLILPPVTLASALSGQTFEFERGFNPITHQDGWRPLQIPDFDPVAPTMVVHDLLEHFAEGTAEVHWEYMALGAAHLLRGEGGFFHKQGLRISDALVPPAFGMLFHHIDHSGLTTEAAPAEPEAFTPVTPFRADVEIMRTVANARDFLRRQHATDLIDASLQHAVGWMRLGFRRAQERYDGIPIRQVSKLIHRVVKRIDSEALALARHGFTPRLLEVQIDPVGDTYHVTVKD